MNAVTHVPDPLRLPLQVLLLIHSAWLAVRAFFVAADGEARCELFERSLLAGELAVCRAHLEEHAGTETGQGPDCARRGAALVILAYLDTQIMLARANAPREFWADVDLLGHRSLGMCLVTETTLAGVDMLRVQQVDGPTHWIRPTALYDMEVIPSDVANRKLAALRPRETDPPDPPPEGTTQQLHDAHDDDGQVL